MLLRIKKTLLKHYPQVIHDYPVEINYLNFTTNPVQINPCQLNQSEDYQDNH